MEREDTLYKNNGCIKIHLYACGQIEHTGGGSREVCGRKENCSSQKPFIQFRHLGHVSRLECDCSANEFPPAIRAHIKSIK